MNKPHSTLPKAPALRPAAVYLVVQICLLAVFFLSAAPVAADPRNLSDGFVGSSTSDDCFLEGSAFFARTSNQGDTTRSALPKLLESHFLQLTCW